MVKGKGAIVGCPFLIMNAHATLPLPPAALLTPGWSSELWG